MVVARSLGPLDVLRLHGGDSDVVGRPWETAGLPLRSTERQRCQADELVFDAYRKGGAVNGEREVVLAVHRNLT